MSTPNDTLPSGLPNPTIHITSHNDAGKSVVRSSGQNEWNWFRDNTVGFDVVYTTSQFPALLNDEADISAHAATMAKGTLGLVSKNGTVCRIVDFGPLDMDPPPTPLMHRTQSLDYGIVLEGEVEMELDDGSVTKMTKGDIAVQRATMHAWRNPSRTQWARMLFVLQDCQPVVVGGQRLREQLGESGSVLPPSGNDD
ncbi:uncharacterized protein Z518_00146 [Rhinocladiella mackenziei CBS 650.93]|uniref:Rhinocladiella mackenziei CBS 650.93 unplaced genomic scaffold supercont1.1, whole genome shotgun sequence n=1 Tax=Rhinocladiella mackenziei CBS 650.93 TaxID=1442369 RepID=A0A0D2HEN4_9EURO|nr:uncharacterized protein Z518_00146 [Rhinocladiella mackenziei CBS 650.93]KIX09068.1 hypothetical protein Z518_00146 [Rhinocladiella mackenziei CBS 650.93]